MNLVQLAEEPRLTVVQMAGSLPRDPMFREWVGNYVDGKPVDEEYAAHFIRACCEVDSRRELATDTEAAQRFHNLVRLPFVAWKEQQEQTV